MTRLDDAALAGLPADVARPAYDRASAERHWERVFSLFRRRLWS